MTFILHPQLATGSILLTDWELSHVLLKNDVTYPWLILVPKQAGVTEIHELLPQNRLSLIEEISRLSSIVQHYFQPTKINVAALGNRVPQLHVHVVARYQGDNAWPYAIWQADIPSRPYEPHTLTYLCDTLRGLLQ